MATLAQNRLQLSEHYSVTYAASLPGDHTLEDAQKPEYWAHSAARLRQSDMIRLIPEDGSYFAELVVVAVGKGYAKVKLLRAVDLHEAVVEDAGTALLDAPMFVKWFGPQVKFGVVRKSDNERIKEGFAEKGQAERWMAEHLAALDR